MLESILEDCPKFIHKDNTTGLNWISEYGNIRGVRIERNFEVRELSTVIHEMRFYRATNELARLSRMSTPLTTTSSRNSSAF